MFYPRKERDHNFNRIKVINKCNKLENDLEYLLSQKILEKEVNKDFLEKKEIVESIKKIINEESFKNEKKMNELIIILKDIQNDIKEQSKLIDKNKNELVHSLIEKIISDTSKKTANNNELFNMLKEETNSKEILEKYILKVMRKQIEKENEQTNIQSQNMNILESNELKKKVEFIDLTIDKLNSMEQLYNKIHLNKPKNKKKIVEIIKKPIKESIKPIANTIYIQED